MVPFAVPQWKSHHSLGMVSATRTSDWALASSLSEQGTVEPADTLDLVSQSDRTGAPVLGVSVVTGFWELPPITSFVDASGHTPGIVMNYQGWSYPQSTFADFPTSQLNQIWQAGYLPEITWDPTDAYSDATDLAYTLESIIDGSHDSYIVAWALAAKAWGHPFLLRFAPEMNGDWLSWGEDVNGNTQGEYVLAWRHVFQVFAKVGAANASWVWSPNVLPDGASVTSLESLYPGNSYVDIVGMDGYSYPNDGCITGSSLFGATLSALSAIAPNKPVLIAETGVASSCTNQAELISELMTWVANQQTVVGVTWFDHPGQPNYQIDSDKAAEAALQGATFAS
jgi:hypothetical protein